jgi:hypothetical protein
MGVDVQDDEMRRPAGHADAGAGLSAPPGVDQVDVGGRAVEAVAPQALSVTRAL